ncbi:flagellar assembly protein FliX [Kordiimonas gwangyangensis]|uniref:flagellar assembly protein FliX n=1 Tax=Kordiimonas gwangyangensis TaxID=288022 RepID=UPI0003827071|nr:flagellar assembly protein FliX [Kordiimonas gwangyangensis]
MKITGPGQIQSKTIKKTSRKSSSSDSSVFTGALDDSAPAQGPARAAAASPLAPVNSLLSLQEVPDSTHSRSKGLKRAEEMLDILEEVRKGLLLGSIPITKLRGLADLARNQRGKTEDAKLNAVLADIELRAEVELAKLGV